MTFGEALEHLQLSGRVRMIQWHNDVFLEIQEHDEHSKMTAPYIYVTSRFGLVPWNPTQIELLSDDWEVG